MSIHLINYKVAGSRKVETFAVVPFNQSSRYIKMQSSNRCVILDRLTSTMQVSPWVRKTPMYLDCQALMGGKRHPIPEDLQIAIANLPPKQAKQTTTSPAYS